MWHLCGNIFKKGKKITGQRGEGNKKRVRNNRGNTKAREEGGVPGRTGAPLKGLQPVKDSSKSIGKEWEGRSGREELLSLGCNPFCTAQLSVTRWGREMLGVKLELWVKSSLKSRKNVFLKCVFGFFLFSWFCFPLPKSVIKYSLKASFWTSCPAMGWAGTWYAEWRTSWMVGLKG